MKVRGEGVENLMRAHMRVGVDVLPVLRTVVCGAPRWVAHCERKSMRRRWIDACYRMNDIFIHNLVENVVDERCTERWYLHLRSSKLS